jgi:hypothetical protein
VRRLLPLSVLLCLLLCAPANASKTQPLTFEAPRDLMDPAKRPAALDELQSLGVRSLRVILLWSSVAPGSDQATQPKFEPTNPAGYDWGQYDALMAAAKARNWPVLMTISGPAPKWATKARLDNKTRPTPSAFAAFTTAVGRHYGDQVRTWAIWNEPNQPQFLLPQFAAGGKAASPAIYRELYRAGVRGLTKAGQGADQFLIGETSPRGTGRVVAPLTFLRGMLCLNAKYKPVGRCAPLSPDGYAHHAYTTKQGPTFKPPPNDVTIGVLSRLTKALDRATAAGALTKRLPIHLTEFGIQSTPDTISGVSLAKQVQYRAISERIAYDNPRVASFSQYLLTDSDASPPGVFSGFESGLRFADGRPKPSLAAFRLPLAVRRSGRKVSIWGLVRPATGVTSATVTYADRGSSTFKRLRTVQTDARGYFQLSSVWRSGRRWNLSWQDQTGSPVGSYTR